MFYKSIATKHATERKERRNEGRHAKKNGEVAVAAAAGRSVGRSEDASAEPLSPIARVRDYQASKGAACSGKRGRNGERGDGRGRDRSAIWKNLRVPLREVVRKKKKKKKMRRRPRPRLRRRLPFKKRKRGKEGRTPFVRSFVRSFTPLPKCQS